MKISDDEQYNKALVRLDELVGVPEFGPLADEYEELAGAIAAYDLPYQVNDGPPSVQQQVVEHRSPPPFEPIYTRVRRLASWVAQNARSVQIVPSAIDQFIDECPFETPPRLEHTAEHHLLDAGEATIAYFLVLDTINFGSGYFPHLKKIRGYSGYYTIATWLKKFFLECGVPSALELSKISATTCGLIFHQDLEDAEVMTLMRLYALSLRELGIALLKRYDGSYVKMVEAAKQSAARMLNILSGLQTFQDYENYRGCRIPFFKRAQIAVHDLAIAFNNQGWGRFDDIDQLTAFADNTIPSVLRSYGILEYSSDLASAIDSGHLIPFGSSEEVELRGCSVDAVQRICARLRERGLRVSDRELDFFLWSHSHSDLGRASKRHLTKTTFY